MAETGFEGFAGLVRIMDRLRSEDGCPWDREQDYRSLRGYLLEECYEAIEALDAQAELALCEELGDLLFQIVFLSRIGKERGTFTIDDVVRGIATKMIRRHPHVFGDERADTSDEVLRNWEEIKRREKGDRAPTSVLAGVPKALPALSKAHRLGTKAARVGFDWTDDRDTVAKVREELSELDDARRSGDAGAIREELGDTLFALAMLARRLGVDPEEALEAANAKFRRRFESVERELLEEGVALEDAGLERMERAWERAKSGERA